MYKRQVIGIVFVIYDISKYISIKKNKNVEDTTIILSIIAIIIPLIFFIVYTPWYYGIGMPESYHDTMSLFENWEPLEKSPTEDPNVNE